jgi:hypothetical protein
MKKLLTSKQYDEVIQRLERIADGISKHKEEPDYPRRLNEAKRREMKLQLENLRVAWENLTREANQAYDAYLEALKASNEQISLDADTLKGFYGKESNILPDYGIKAFTKPSGRSKKSTQSTS